MADVTDRFTREWWGAQFEGACHSMNMLAREQATYTPRFEALWRRLEEQQTEIGEMKAVIAKMTERIDKASVKYTELRQRVEKPGLKAEAERPAEKK